MCLHAGLIVLAIDDVFDEVGTTHPNTHQPLDSYGLD